MGWWWDKECLPDQPELGTGVADLQSEPWRSHEGGVAGKWDLVTSGEWGGFALSAVLIVCLLFCLL